MSAMPWARALLLVCAGSLCAWPAAADVPPAPAAEVAAVAVPAELVLHRVAGTLLVGATADGKLVTYDISDPRTPQKRGERDLGGTIVDLRVTDGVVFAVVAEQRVQAFAVAEGGKLEAWRPVAVASPNAVAPAAPPARAAASAVLGKVATAHGGSVLIELDSAGTLRPGDHVLIRSQSVETRLNLFSGKEEAAVTNAPVAVLEVRQVQGTRAIAELGRGDNASVGDTVEVTDRPASRSSIFAGRAGYDTWARATLRPMLNFGKVDVASVTELAFGYYWQFLHLQARVAPLGFSVPHGVDAANMQVIVSYSNDLFEFGLGTGYFRHEFQTLNDYDCSSNGFLTGSVASADSSGGAVHPQRFNCAQSGPTVVQHLRLGAIDGLNLRVTDTVTISSGQFRWGYLEGSLDIPLTRELNLYGAGGGTTGLGWGEVGMRTYLRGVGGHGTLILSTGIGGSSLRTSEIFGGELQTIPGRSGANSTSYINEQNSVGGLHIAVGLEYRH